VLCRGWVPTLAAESFLGDREPEGIV